MSHESEKADYAHQLIANCEILSLTKSCDFVSSMNGGLLRVLKTSGNVTFTLPKPAGCPGWNTHIAFTSANQNNFTLVCSEPSIDVMSDAGIVTQVDQTSFLYPCPVGGSMLCVACDGTRWIVNGGTAGLARLTSNFTMTTALKNQLFTVVPRTSSPLVISLPHPIPALLQGNTWRFAVSSFVAGGSVRFTAGTDNIVHARRLTGTSMSRSASVTSVTLTEPALGTVIEVVVTATHYVLDIYSPSVTVTTS
jgi:hypothetical protein